MSLMASEARLYQNANSLARYFSPLETTAHLIFRIFSAFSAARISFLIHEPVLMPSGSAKENLVQEVV
jgi:hypothetical protein